MVRGVVSCLAFVCLCLSVSGQSVSSSIRGKITDKDSKIGLIGATIAVFKDSAMIAGNTSDANGEYRISNVPVGRYTVIVSYIGYSQAVISDVILNSGKEYLLHVELEESIIKIKEITISGIEARGEVLNEMASVSARAFSVEETDRYAGSRSDPSRMAANFAGVGGSNDNSNDIVIRGNSPLGVLWRMEGVNIPNPNHFAVAGNTGGPVGMLNNKVLSNSDFYTGAFPAEYGNSIAGVFDLRMRNGNNEKNEFSGQFGFLGTELMAEGPISKKRKSSFLAAYKYSTLAIFNAIGVDIGTDAVPQYQDLTFRLHFPVGKRGFLSVFGLGGLSKVDILKSIQTDTADVDIYGNAGVDEQFRSGMGVIGISLLTSLSDRSYLKATLSASLEGTSNVLEKIHRHIANGQFVLDSLTLDTGYRFRQGKGGLSLAYNHKISARHTMRAGLVADHYMFNFVDSIFNESSQAFEIRLDHNGQTQLIQPYLQWRWKINETLSVNSGLHAQYLSLNNSASLEPRIGLKWRITPAQSFSFGLGLHSQMAPTYTYFIQATDSSGNSNNYNSDIGFLKSRHLVAGYDNYFSRNLRLRIETYIQWLYNIPVETKSSSYSVLNEGDDLNRFFPGELQNTGTGRNYGVELTIERFFSKSFFYMLTGSLYNSTYTGSDGNRYNTTYNGRYILNLLATKEFAWGKRSNKTFGIGGKITWAGGKRYTPINISASDSVGYAVLIDGQRNTMQFKDYFRFDIKLNFKVNNPKVTHETGLDLVNLLGVKNVFKQTYIGGPEPLREEYQLGFLPILYYRLDF